MTLREAVEQKVARVRLPEWNASAYIELPKVGPWATLHDEIAAPGQPASFLLAVCLSTDTRVDYAEVADV